MSKNTLIVKLRGRMTQQEIADKIGISRSYYSEIEQGVTPSLEVAIKLARYHGISVESMWPLVGGKGGCDECSTSSSAQ